MVPAFPTTGARPMMTEATDAALDSLDLQSSIVLLLVPLRALEARVLHALANSSVFIAHALSLLPRLFTSFAFLDLRSGLVLPRCIIIR